jgi:hypothetical protein
VSGLGLTFSIVGVKLTISGDPLYRGVLHYEHLRLVILDGLVAKEFGPVMLESFKENASTLERALNIW